MYRLRNHAEQTMSSVIPASIRLRLLFYAHCRGALSGTPFAKERRSLFKGDTKRAGKRKESGITDDISAPHVLKRYINIDCIKHFYCAFRTIQLEARTMLFSFASVAVSLWLGLVAVACSPPALARCSE